MWQHTVYKRANTKTESVKWSLAGKHDNVHTVERQKWVRISKGGLQFESTITYILWEGEGGNGISKGVCSLKAWSHTRCGKVKVATGSARGSAVWKHDHVQTVRRSRQWWDQQGGLQFESTITYKLCEGQGGDKISKGFCSLKARSCTSCGKAKAATGSVRGLQFESMITYHLWESKGSNRISKRVCSLKAQSCTPCGNVRVSKGVCSLKAQSLTPCGKAKVAMGSARGSAVWKHDHLHTVGRQRWQQDQ